MRTGLYVLCIFAAAWGALACSALAWPVWSWALPALVSAGVAAYAGPRVFATSDRPVEQRRRVSRLVATWSGAEAVVIPITCVILANTGHGRQAVPAMALIVGLHFFPLARGLPFPIYYATGAVLTLASMAAMFAPGPVGPQAAAGIAGALILWATSLAMPSAIGRTPPNDPQAGSSGRETILRSDQ